MTLKLPTSPFYVMRHGETTDNALGIISGAGSDPHLTDLGREQAKAAAVLFKALPVEPEKIVTSSLRRTHQTAEIVAGHIKFTVDADLDERHLGELDGKISEAEQKERKTLPGEESAGDHASRVLRAVYRHTKDKSLVLFVCHGGTIRRITEALNISVGINAGNAKIYYFSSDKGGWACTEISG